MLRSEAFDGQASKCAFEKFNNRTAHLEQVYVEPKLPGGRDRLTAQVRCTKDERARPIGESARSAAQRGRLEYPGISAARAQLAFTDIRAGVAGAFGRARNPAERASQASAQNVSRQARGKTNRIARQEREAEREKIECCHRPARSLGGLFKQIADLARKLFGGKWLLQEAGVRF